jgi:hypothetical protein
MPDTKITALAAITTVAPANDLFPIVDVSDNSMAASGTTKNITVNQLLGAGGTATLASATITGDLTVDTSTLKVDSANNRVGIGTASPMAELHVIGGANFSDGTTTLRAVSSGNVALLGTTTTDPLVLRVNNIEQYRMAQLGVFSWSDGAGGTRMTLNSSGLGVGMSPANNLSIGSTTYASFGVKIDSITQSSLIFKGTPDAAGYEHAKIVSGRESSPFTYGSFLAFYTEGKNSGTTDTSTERLRIDSSGNVGVGVTPNTGWQSSWKALDIGSIGGVSFGFGQTDITSNVYRINTGAARYKAAGSAATSYTQVSGTHIFLTAGVAANANDPITFNPALTINASGLPIFLATTTTPASLTTNGELTFTATSNTNLRFSYRGSDGTTRVANITLA